MISDSEQIQEKRRTKILFVIESLAGGGAEKVLATLVRLIDKEKFQVSVCTVVDTGVYTEDVKKNADTYTSILGNPARTGFVRKLWHKIMYKLVYRILPMRWAYAIFVPHHADVEVAFIEGFVTKLMASSSNSKAKKIAWVHTDLERNHWTSYLHKNNKQETTIYHRYHRVVCVSKSAEKAFSNLFPSSVSSLTCYNPIDFKNVIENARQASLLPDKKEHVFRIISCGRLVPQKGFDRLIQAISQSEVAPDSIELYIYGSGSEESLLMELIHQNHLQDTIHLCGFRQDYYRDLKTADLFICSSRAEGFSLVIAEALILGIPVLSTYCSGPNELLEDGKYGVLCENTTKSLSLSISSLCRDKEKLNYYKKMASERGEQLKTLLSIEVIENALAQWGESA